MDISLILTKRYPGTLWGLSGNDYSDLEWFDESPKPTEQELIDLWEEVVLEQLRETVEQKRKIEFQKYADPLFFGWQRGENTQQEWLDVVEQIRIDNPYPEEL